MHDYVAGKADWTAAGLPTIRAEGGEPRAVDVLDQDLATCAPTARVSELPSDRAVVVLGGGGVVLGRVPPGPREGSGSVVDAMEPGPSTVRAHEPLDPLFERMARRDVDEILVTTPEGRLLGLVRRPAGRGEAPLKS